MWRKILLNAAASAAAAYGATAGAGASQRDAGIAAAMAALMNVIGLTQQPPQKSKIENAENR